MTVAPSVQDLQKKVAELQNKRYPDHWSLLKEVGVYFHKFEPRKIDPAYVKRFASYINDLYVEMDDSGQSAKETRIVLKILGKVNTQCHKIETKKLDDEYFENYKKLGRALITLADSWAKSIGADTVQ